ncbi:MAG: M24 family metallopeptidase, partial [Rhodothermales bacterium]|nr:M24 family metallopeptidase [Rhodothermales bacterium]
RAGAARMSFDPIVAFGENAALPHGRPSTRELRQGDPILVDMGCFLNDYASDMTRMFSLGHPGADFMAVYQTVLDALNRAAEAARSGMSSSALDGLARDVIASAGLGDSFSHSLGHGVGLEIHEAPSVSYRSDALLPTGAVITLEPGVYLPGRFGIRIEDIVRLGPEGCDVITSSPRDLVVL